VIVPDHGAEGVIVAEGGSSGGYTLYVQDGRLHYDYNFFGRVTYRVASGDKLPAGRAEIVLDCEQQPFKRFAETKGGPARLYVNGKLVGEGDIANVVPFRFSATETLDIGMDLGAPVSEVYRKQAPFAFTGRIEGVTIDLK
jgi:hypothetical protein